MILKIIIALLGILNGGWMIFDGFHVLKKGKYFGPDKPGPWSSIISRLGIDPFKMGPVFIFIGTLWMIAVAGIISGQHWGRLTGIAASLMTLWYLPVGTILSLIVLLLLVILKG